MRYIEKAVVVTVGGAAGLYAVYKIGEKLINLVEQKFEERRKERKEAGLFSDPLSYFIPEKANRDLPGEFLDTAPARIVHSMLPDSDLYNHLPFLDAIGQWLYSKEEGVPKEGIRHEDLTSYVVPETKVVMGGALDRYDTRLVGAILPKSDIYNKIPFIETLSRWFR